MLGYIRFAAVLLLLAAAVASLSGCTIGAAYLIYDELKDDDPLVIWEGVVRESDGTLVQDAIVMVQYKLGQKVDPEEHTYQGTTDENGEFSVELRFSRFATYSVLLVHLDRSTRPPDYQDIFIVEENKTDLKFDFDITKP